MSFIAPWMLWGVAATGIPVAIHLFFRSRYRRIPWGAMSFLLASMEQTSRRLKFQELLLLLLRMALLGVLALALARPSSSGMFGGSDAVDAVFVFDTSYSMDAREAGSSRLQQARQAALRIIDQLPPSSAVQVVACSDRARHFGPHSPSSLDQVRRVLENLPLTNEATNFQPAVAEIDAALARGFAVNKEVYFFSDMQRSGWQQPALAAALAELRERAALFTVRCGGTVPRNATIVSVEPQATLLHAGERTSLVVLVRNTGVEPLLGLSVRLSTAGQQGEVATASVDSLAPGETQAVVLSARLTRAGLQVVTAEIDHDDLPADNRFDRLLLVSDEVRILVVDGALSKGTPEKSAGYYLMHGLKPIPESQWSGYFVQPHVVSSSQAIPPLLDDADLCLLVDVPLGTGSEAVGGGLSPLFVERLGEYVRQGGGLVVFAGPQVQPENYNRVLGDGQGLLPARLIGFVNPPNQAAMRRHIDPQSAGEQSFLGRFREPPLDRIAQVEITQAFALKISEDSSEARGTQVLLRDDQGEPIVVRRPLGAGEVIFVATTADARWTDWPLKPTYLPFVQATTNHLLQQRLAGQQLLAGESIRWSPPTAAADEAFVLVPPSGEKRPLGKPTSVAGRPWLSTNDTSQAGIYQLAPAAGMSDDRNSPAGDAVHDAIYAVTSDLRETVDLTTFSDRELDDQLGFDAIHLSAEGDVGNLAAGARLRHEHTFLLLWAVLAFCLIEPLFAWFSDRAS
jgi:hypothetical protein